MYFKAKKIKQNKHNINDNNIKIKYCIANLCVHRRASLFLSSLDLATTGQEIPLTIHLFMYTHIYYIVHTGTHIHTYDLIN